MKSEKNILIAFILNLSFSVFELVGGLWVGSVAVLSDSLHDLGDALSIGVSYFLERKSNRPPDDKYTYGYGRYSVIGAAFTTLLLIVGSVGVISASVSRMFHPLAIDYDGMILMAVVGLVVNFIAAYITHGAHSANERAVSLHMLEDVLGWAVVLVGAIVMRFTDLNIIDPIMSIGVSVFIFYHALRNLAECVAVLTDRAPRDIDVSEIRKQLLEIDGIVDVHHLHLRMLNVDDNSASVHIVVRDNDSEIKKLVRNLLREFHIEHVTIALEHFGEECPDAVCAMEKEVLCHSHHNHHNHHSHHCH